MSRQTDNMKHVLAKLGEAHREGVFSGDATRYPWRTAEPEASCLTHRRFAWARVAAPLAAAAAVAVLFVGPSLWGPRAVHKVAENGPGSDTLVKPESPAVVEPVPTTAESVSCDYNGDGQVDGRDIQAFWDSRRGTDGDMRLLKEELQRCLLSGK
ncbi:hypothetical protein JXA88_13620 [Candidatus Fermentibacteria bacterium]|nr:hypothetical protein [Candidatus Fermentibacteria bacterium]